jgi:hypothetical protein
LFVAIQRGVPDQQLKRSGDLNAVVGKLDGRSFSTNVPTFSRLLERMRLAVQSRCPGEGSGASQQRLA